MLRIFIQSVGICMDGESIGKGRVSMSECAAGYIYGFSSIRDMWQKSAHDVVCQWVYDDVDFDGYADNMDML